MGRPEVGGHLASGQVLLVPLPLIAHVGQRGQQSLLRQADRVRRVEAAGAMVVEEDAGQVGAAAALQVLQNRAQNGREGGHAANSVLDARTGRP